jgi:hypothetical protein
MAFGRQEHDLHKLFPVMFETNDAVASLTTSALGEREKAVFGCCATSSRSGASC